MDNSKAILSAICILLALSCVIWKQEEPKPVQLKAKYPQVGIIEKECIKTGIYCPVLANGVFDNR